ncbi:hypothetical protein MHYP_G00219930 [Metynnis hypsauchen]
MDHHLIRTLCRARYRRVSLSRTCGVSEVNLGQTAAQTDADRRVMAVLLPPCLKVSQADENVLLQFSLVLVLKCPQAPERARTDSALLNVRFEESRPFREARAALRPCRFPVGRILLALCGARVSETPLSCAAHWAGWVKEVREGAEPALWSAAALTSPPGWAPCCSACPATARTAKWRHCPKSFLKNWTPRKRPAGESRVHCKPAGPRSDL